MEVNDKELEKVATEFNRIKEQMAFINTEEFLSSNEIIFIYKDQTYRVRKPTFGEHQDVYKFKMNYMYHLLKQKNEDNTPKYPSEKELCQVYLQRGIDIYSMDSRLKAYDIEIEKIKSILGESLTKDGIEDNELKMHKEKMLSLLDQKNKLNIERIKLLEGSIESLTNIEGLKYLTMLVIDKQVGEKQYNRLWNTVEELDKAPNELVNYCIYYTSLINNN